MSKDNESVTRTMKRWMWKVLVFFAVAGALAILVSATRGC